jgi:hypothetical protein
MSDTKIKLGLLTDSFCIPAWIYSSLERVARSSHAEFSLMILDEKSNDGTRSDHTKINGDHIIYKLFNKIDEKLYLRKPDALQPKDLHGILSNIPVVRANPIRDGDINCYQAAEINQIKENNIDLLVKIGPGNLKGEILTVAKNGVWTYQIGSTAGIDGDLQGYWDAVERQSGTNASLIRLAEDMFNSKVLCQTGLATYPFSPARNRNSCLWAASSLLPRQIERLHRLGCEQFNFEVERNHSGASVFNDPQDKIPITISALKPTLKHLSRIVYELYQRGFYLDYWHLLFGLDKDEPLKFDKFIKILPPKDRFWADPHVVQKDGIYYVFIEEYLHKNRKGHISVMEFDQLGNYKDPVRILEKKFHLSFPFVFEHDHKFYMVPESAQNRTIELYECIEFPHEWQFKMNLMENVRAVDTVLFFHRDKWWLFTAITENEGAFPQTELFLFYANDLFTDKWKPHPQNPIISDMKKARSAGRIYIKNGITYRPSQYCTTHYGYGFGINEILTLNETEYMEREVVSVKPSWDKRILATHTFTWDGQLTVIDAMMKRRKLL